VPEDLLFQSEIKEVVRDAYAHIDAGAGRPAAQRLYSEDELTALPAGAVDWALGVGNPVRHAALKPGESVPVYLQRGGGRSEYVMLTAPRP